MIIMKKFSTEEFSERKDLNKKSKEEFSSAVNKQKGRVSRKLIEKTLFILLKSSNIYKIFIFSKMIIL